MNHPLQKIKNGVLVDLTQEEIEEYNLNLNIDDTPIIASQVRRERNSLLSSSDWTQVSDAPVDQEAWALYRQALRDITEQEGFPHEVTWPNEPVVEKPVTEEPAVLVEERMEEITPE